MFKEPGSVLDTLKEMLAEKAKHLFFLLENFRRKDDAFITDHQAVYERLTGSEAVSMVVKRIPGEKFTSTGSVIGTIFHLYF